MVLEGLRLLECRGYDSVGIAMLVTGHIEKRRVSGWRGNLAAALERCRQGCHSSAADRPVARQSGRTESLLRDQICVVVEVPTRE
jgi:hypothetical protein